MYIVSHRLKTYYCLNSNKNMNNIVDYNLDEDYTYLDCMVELEKMIRDVYVLSEDYLFGLDISNKELQFAHEVRKCMIISIDEYDEMPEDIVDKLAGSSTEKITVLVRQIREHSHSRDIMFYYVFGYSNILKIELRLKNKPYWFFQQLTKMPTEISYIKPMMF